MSEIKSGYGQWDLIVVGAGLAGLVAALEVAEAGKTVVIVDRESEDSMGGQAFWSLGGLFLVNSLEQRRLGIRDSFDLALQDWMGNAGFDREEDYWPRKWAEAYVAFAAEEKRSWLLEKGLRFFPVVGWAERGGYGAIGPGNSVPRFHVSWGTGPGVLHPFVWRVYEAVKRGLITLKFRHKVTELLINGGIISGVQGEMLEPGNVARGVKSSSVPVGNFRYQSQAVIIASGGIGANHELVRRNWPKRLGTAPVSMISGVPDYVDGSMMNTSEAAGAKLINSDRMWHYTEGVKNWNPIWSNHGIRVIPGPSSLWFDARGTRLPVPLFPGFDTLGSLEHIVRSGYDYSWFVLTEKIMRKEFALSGSEQNPDLTNKRWDKTLLRALKKDVPSPVQQFKKKGSDFIVKNNLSDLVSAMNALTTEPLIDPSLFEQQIQGRDRELKNPFSKDMQITAMNGARNYLGDKLIRVAKPHKILDPENGPLIAVRLHILTRKTLGGLQTDLSGRVFGKNGVLIQGLFAAGEVAGFGGGGMHGYRALEGTFLGGCIFSGRTAGRAAAQSAV